VVINHIGLVAGLATAFWYMSLCYWKRFVRLTIEGPAMASATGKHRTETTMDGVSPWRFNLYPSLSSSVGSSFARKRTSCPHPTSLLSAHTCRPRWLVEHGRIEAAKRNLAWLRALEPDHILVLAELKEMEVDVAQRQVATAQGWTVLFTNRPLFNRMWRAALLQFMAQMCGNTSMKYYLPSIFMSLGIERKLTLMIGGIESTLKIGCTIIDTWLVDRYGRRLTLVLSCFVMSLALLVRKHPPA
jgi:hypothetical protein